MTRSPSRPANTNPDEVKAALQRELGRDFLVRTGEEAAEQQAQDFAGGARLHPDRAAGVRRRRAARRRLSDLQHVHGHGRAAHEGVRAAARPRRLAGADPALGADRDDHRRARGVAVGRARRPGRRARAGRADGLGGHRPRHDRDGDHAQHGHHRRARRPDRDGRVGLHPGPARDPHRAGGRDARQRHAGRRRPAPAPRDRLAGADGARPGDAVLRPAGRDRLGLHGRGAGRPRCGPDDVRRRVPRAAAGAAAGAGAWALRSRARRA